MSAVERRILTDTPDLRHYGGEQISIEQRFSSWNSLLQCTCERWSQFDALVVIRRCGVRCLGKKAVCPTT
jgi:hypothetical protein